MTSSVGCTRCPRLVRFREEVREQHPDYHAAPVESVGPLGGPLLIVGLAPGMHGANATGRPFTGDHAGLLLYRTLHAFGWSSAPESRAPGDGLTLYGCRITNAVRCVPPGNKPVGSEVRQCAGYLAGELAATGRERWLERHGPPAVLALGRLAHDAVLGALGLTRARYPFAHGSEHTLPSGHWLVSSYHCSRYNTQTGRLTEAMLGEVFHRITEGLRET